MNAGMIKKWNFYIKCVHLKCVLIRNSRVRCKKKKTRRGIYV